MAESLNVIALISGGKDSFFSILHCMRHGHKVVALANLYPEVVPPQERAGAVEGMKGIEQDLNSFMYQTVGYTLIPLYEKALGIPLYRQQITGSAVQTHTSYSHAHISEKSSPKVGDKASEDETESLVPLLKKVMQEHPSANALSTGAILSTYQRTRVESVALRLGLTPLSYLWKYPVLPPATQMSLLEDMGAVGMDARIVKVASGGLDESFLWENVASENAMRRIERAMGRFGVDGDGAVLGEGGEFETLVIDGPRRLFKERIEVPDGNWRVVREEGGSAWLNVFDARSVVKAPGSATQEDCRIPGLFEQKFEGILDLLQKYNSHDEREEENTEVVRSVLPYSLPLVPESRQGDVLYWTITAKGNIDQGISDEAEEIMAGLRHRLSHASIEAREITSATIVLRSMQDFRAVNQVYGALFTHPNPPSRVTISCGPAMPTGINIILHLKIANTALSRRGLHVQSRSYWAPANIGPYSQAISICQTHNTSWTVHIAGQIPLIPSTMQLPPSSPPSSPQDTFALQSILALQHLFRIAEETNVYWFTSAVAYLPHTPLSPSSLTISSRAIIAGHAWSLAHPFSSDSDEEEDSEPDLWEAKHHHHFSSHHSTHASKKREIPDRERISGSLSAPPFFAVEVHELPRSASVEWHAHIGVAGDLSGEEGSGRVHVSMWEKADDGWKVYGCRIGEGRVISIFMLFYLHNSGILRLGDGVRQAGMEMQGVCACYVDVSDSGSGKRIWEGESGMVGMVPCRSIWDEEGRRIAAVVIFDRDSM